MPLRSFISWLTAFTPVPVTLWYVDTTTRLMVYLWCSGFSATTIWMVEQLGLAMILSFTVRISALISGTISGFEGSMRHADELSMTVIPASANLGAHSVEVLPP